MCVNNTLNSFGAQRFRRVQKTIQIGRLQSLSKVYEVHYAVHPKENCCSNRQHSHMLRGMQVIGEGSRDSRWHFRRHPSTTDMAHSNHRTRPCAVNPKSAVFVQLCNARPFLL